MTIQKSANSVCDKSIRENFSSDYETSIDDDLDNSFLEKQTLLDSMPSKASSWSIRAKLANLIRETYSRPCLLAWLQTIILAILPSYISRHFSRTPIKQENTNAIAALDGLRGLACLFVFNEHLTYNYTRTFLFGYGVDNLRTVIQWPFIRVFWSGFSMVSIFYVISGYVLSYKVLKQMRGKDLQSFQKTITSSVFRRAIRLYMPTIIAVLICGVCVYLGAFTRAREVFNDRGNILQLHEPTPPVLDGFISQIYDAIRQALHMLNFWDWTDNLSAGDYDLHTWTIVVEFRSSMVLFLFMVGVSRLKQVARLASQIFFITFCILTARRDVVLFISGMLIAELDIIRKNPTGKSSVLPTSTLINNNGQYSRFFSWPLIFGTGLFFASVPTIGAESTPGFRTLISFVPSTFEDNASFLRAIGAILTTWSVANSEHLKPIFTNPFSSYLGKISYALYLVHGNVLKSVGYSITPTIYKLTSTDGTIGNVTSTGMVLTWLLVAVIVVPITFWLADIFWRVVDIPCMKLARWVEMACSDDFEDEKR